MAPEGREEKAAKKVVVVTDIAPLIARGEVTSATELIAREEEERIFKQLEDESTHDPAPQGFGDKPEPESFFQSFGIKKTELVNGRWYMLHSLINKIQQAVRHNPLCKIEDVTFGSSGKFNEKVEITLLFTEIGEEKADES